MAKRPNVHNPVANAVNIRQIAESILPPSSLIYLPDYDASPFAPCGCCNGRMRQVDNLFHDAPTIELQCAQCGCRPYCTT